MRIRHVLFFFLCFFILFSYSGCGKNTSGKKPPEALQGVLDLRNWDFQKDGLVTLDGDWEFYWHSFLVSGKVPLNSIEKEKVFIHVPDPWNSYQINGQNLSRAGYGTYRLKILCRPEQLSLAFKAMEIATSYRIYVNNKLLGGIGKPGENEKDTVWRFGSAIYEFNNKGPLIDVAIEVANYTFKDGGIIAGISFGQEARVHDFREKKLLFDIFLCGSLLIMGIYHLSLYALRKKDTSSYYFGLFCLIIFIRTLLVDDYYLSYLFPGVPYDIFYKMDILTIFMSPPVFISFIHSLFGSDLPEMLKKIFTLPGYLFSLFVLLTPSTLFTLSPPYFFIVIIISCLYVFTILIRSVIKKREGSLLLLSGFLFLFIVIVNDILNAQYIIFTTHLIPLGLFIFIFSQAFLISYRSSRTFAAVETLTSGLEKKVIERTRELQIEQNKLRQQNKSMLEELKLAQKIQEQFIPKKSPLPNISFYYKPMEQVGGDFLDFIQMPSGNTGIFLSDVSGHGVGAAFVTSMIKSFTLQFGPFISSPAELLNSLNDFLFNMTGGQFITAFYGIYDPVKLLFTYANAGHNLPFIIKDNSIRQLDGEKRGLPLAVLDKDNLSGYRKHYGDDSIVLTKGTKLLFYTDGLLETVNIYDKINLPDIDIRDFEATELIGSLKEFSHLSSEKLIKKITERLVEFRGSSEFDDDICIISIDI
jgi:serine phosphatase RsbU (regulator of sigma subunit)